MWHLFGKSLVGRSALPISGGTWFNDNALPALALDAVKTGRPLTPKRELRGKVTLIDFWDYSCINCINSLPYLREWWERYRQYDFMVIGIHTPEFTFGADAEKVRSAMLRFNIPYPVVNDPEYENWERYKNDAWPRRLIVDSRGTVRYDHRGAGDYQTAEAKIQELLKKTHRDQAFVQPLEPLRPVDHPDAVCYPATPKIYFGWRLGKPAHTLRPNEEVRYELPADLPNDSWALQGTWLAQEDDLIAVQAESRLDIRFTANDIFAVMRSLDANADTVELLLDGQPLTKDVAGEDVHFSEGKSLVKVTEDRLYRLLANKTHGQHQLTVMPAAGVAFHTMTFGSSCK